MAYIVLSTLMSFAFIVSIAGTLLAVLSLSLWDTDSSTRVVQPDTHTASAHLITSETVQFLRYFRWGDVDVGGYKNSHKVT